MKIHFIGIGGIGISALAQYYLEKGNIVSGSDLCQSEITKALSQKGVKIFIGKHRENNLARDTNLVIYSLAVTKDNPEIKKARQLKIRLKSYPEALGELTKNHFTIAVCGMHGKSTSTALLSLILVKVGLDPTVIIGTKLKEFGDSNFRVGKGKYWVIEADEYKAAFLNYWPQMILLTSLEREHLDYYKNLQHIVRTFEKFISRLPQNGVLVANKDDKNVLKLAEKIKKNKNQIKVIFYSLGDKEAEKIKKTLKIPGNFNISNALGVLSVARTLRIPDEFSFQVFSNYRGAWRRFEIFPTSLHALPYTLISDYGHHPTQIKVTIKAAREKFPQRRIILIYQPHQIKRTKILFKKFIKAFDDVNILFLNEIFGVAGREEKGKKKISSKILARAIRKRWQKLGYSEKIIKFIKNQDDIFKEVGHLIKKRDIVIVMGAGDIYKLALRLLSGR